MGLFEILGKMSLRYYLPTVLICSPLTLVTSPIWIPICIYYGCDENKKREEIIFENIVCALIWPCIPIIYCINK